MTGARRTGVTARFATPLTRILLVVVMAALAWRTGHYLGRDGAVADVAALLLVAYLAWLALEIPVTFRAQPAKPPAECNTLVGYASVRSALVLSAIVPPSPWSAWSGWLALATAVFVSGVVLRLLAIRELGASYTHHVVGRQQDPVVTTGPYRFLRHPAYAGMLLANLGFVVVFANPASVAAMVALTVVLRWRIRVEERAMWTVPGYPEFARKRARLVVGVW